MLIKNNREGVKMKRTGGILRNSIVVTLSLILLILCVPVMKAGAAEPIKVGVVLSISGWAGFIGTPMKEALVAIVEDTNKKGGIKGRPLELYIEDDKSNPTNAVIATTKLARDIKVSVLMGPATADAGMAMIPIAEQEQVPFAVSGPVIAPFKKWVFHVTPSDLVSSAAVIEYAVKELGGKKIAVIHDTANFGMTGMKVFNAEIGKYPGSSIVIAEKFETTDTNVIPQLTKIKAANPDVLIVQAPGGQAAVIAKNYKQLGMKMTVTGPPAVTTPEFLKIGGSVAEESPWILLGGKIMVAERLAPSDPWRKNLYEPFKKIMRDKYGDKPIMVFHSVAHDAIHIVIEALKTAGSDDRNAVRNALESVKYEGTMGPYACTPTDHRGIIVYNGLPVVVKNGDFSLYTK
jgi:branched-chain amino acid transport system substrate-binding protein